MRYVFLGGRESVFAEIILQGLINAGFKPLASFRDAKVPLNNEELKSLNADFFLVAAFGKILKKEIIDIPPKGVIGVHPSLLPKYRGPSPIQSVILNEEKETGVTLFLIDEKVDHGPTIGMGKLLIASDDNYEDLTRKLGEISAPLILGVIPEWLKKEIEPRIQNEAQATYTEKFSGEDAKVNLENENPKKIWLKIRALNPEPGVYAMLNLRDNTPKMRLKLLEADFDSMNGRLKLKTVQPESKKPMDNKTFLNGYQNKIDPSILTFFL